MAKAKKLPSGAWRVLAYLGTDVTGKRQYKSFTDPDRKRCERMAAEYLDEHRIVINRNEFGTAMDAYIFENKAILSPSTIRGYNAIAKSLKREYEAFCSLLVRDITQNVLQTLVNNMSIIVSPKTVRNRYGLITAVIRSKGYLPPSVKLPEKKRPDLKIPDTNDVRYLLECAKDTEMEIPILLAAFGPMRRGEIVALKMEDIKGNVIHVKRAVVIDENNGVIEKVPKTYDSDRYIIMPKYIIEKIKRKGMITKYDNPNYLTNAFRRLVNQCGLEGLRLHDLRHYGASYLHAIGVPEQYILERGGWSSPSVMKNVYRHSLASETDEISKGIITSFEKTFFQ